jgi:hypothetical protein
MAVKSNSLFLYFVTAVLFLTVSCKSDMGEEKGTFVIQNKAYDDTLEITDVWLKGPGSMGWVNYWHGSCMGGDGLITELSFTVNPGQYDVRIKVNRYGFLYAFYETGYQKSVRIRGGDYQFIIYDGAGIYDE